MLSRLFFDYAAIPVLPFDLAAATEYERLLALRVRVGTMDLRIAAIALPRKLILVTRNVRDFGQVPALLTEDWTV
jgi:tRNA(fMet)-specific endonuclease VapC